ncbi:MAG: quinone-dependent dihydroorotate dehydrogenase [Pseudomonadota bacterium]
MTSAAERVGLALMRRVDPERAHGLAITALRAGLTPKPGPVSDPVLRTSLGGLDLPNPVGLAAGFDKNAEAVAPLMQAGFGWIEVGAATPLPQPGNSKPRLFRLTEDRAAINRFGFNNDGAEAIATRLARRPSGVPVGLNLGANKDSANRADDFARVLDICRAHLDFATVNVSSPNTEKLRDLQGPMALAALLDGVMAKAKGLPIFLKIAPDLTDQDLADIAKVAEDARLAGIIATNTTLDRGGLRSVHAHEKGGLSGAPLMDKSTRVLAKLARLTKLPLVGVGGVDSAGAAYTKIRAGASAVQLYTGLVYGGLSLASRIATGLAEQLHKDGFQSIEEARGTGIEDWL